MLLLMFLCPAQPSKALSFGLRAARRDINRPSLNLRRAVRGLITGRFGKETSLSVCVAVLKGCTFCPFKSSRSKRAVVFLGRPRPSRSSVLPVRVNFSIRSPTVLFPTANMVAISRNVFFCFHNSTALERDTADMCFGIIEKANTRQK